MLVNDGSDGCARLFWLSSTNLEDWQRPAVATAIAVVGFAMAEDAASNVSMPSGAAWETDAEIKPRSCENERKKEETNCFEFC